MYLLLNVDFQGDFVFKNWALPVPGAEDLIIPMTEYTDSLDPNECVGVVNTRDTHTPEKYFGSPEQEIFKDIHCEKGTKGWETVLDLKRMSKTGVPIYTLDKGIFDMWGEPGLRVTGFENDFDQDRDEFFADLRKKGIREVKVIGVASDYCVKQAIDGLLARGFHVTVLKRLTKGINQDISQVAAGSEYAYNCDLVVV